MMTPLRPSETMRLPLPETRLPGDWRGEDLAKDPDAYTVLLHDEERRALHALTTRIERGGVGEPIASDVHAILARATDVARARLTSGDGFVRVRGVPTEGFSRATLATLFTHMGTALGEPMPQNLEGERVTDIRDTGADPKDREVRLYRTRAEQDFHTDGADIIGLLSLHPAASGGLSRIVSSVQVYRRVASLRPDLAPLLGAPWWFHLPGGKERGQPPAIPRPIVSFDGQKLESFFIGWYIRNATVVSGVPPLTDAQRELLALYEATANDPSLYLDMDLRPGDVQWLRNAFILHKRTAYDDPAPPAPKRHLLRLWLSASFIDDTMPWFEGGEVRS